VGDPLLVTVVAGSPTTDASPEGDVELAVGTFRLTAPLVGGVATFSIPTTLAMGAHVATASYGGDGARFGAATASAPVTVVRGTSTLTAEIPATATAGAMTRLTAVLGHSGTVATPGGGVMFMDGGRPIAFEQLSVDAEGRITATFATAGLAPGDHYFQLVYLGNPGTYASSSPLYKLTVAAATSAASTATAKSPASNISRISNAADATYVPIGFDPTTNKTRTANPPPPGPTPGRRAAFAGRMRTFASPARFVARPPSARVGARMVLKTFRYLDLQ
jgi:hypothetical protein